MKADSGSEFAGKILDRWAYKNGVVIDFSPPGKPTDNAAVESFYGSPRKECLNSNWFLSLEEAEEKIEHWRAFYNQLRPHSSLEWHAPETYAEKQVLSEDLAE
jgi:putative transposase